MATKQDTKFADLLAESKLEIFKPGDMIQGEVYAKGSNKIWVDIQGHSLGLIFSRELSADSPDLTKGDKVTATVIEPENDEGYIILSLRSADREKFWGELKAKFESGETLNVKVVDANKGGLMIETNGIRGFLPVSQLASDHYPRVDGGDKRKILEKLNELMNSTLEVKIITFDKDRNNLIFSEKAAGDKVKEQAISGLKVSDKVKGIISGIIDFGLFIRFNNIEGLVHISEISWEKN
ncbi:MAG: S1 RNA-binding domain-containing protein [bacterium]